jgi:hypothetical protein
MAFTEFTPQKKEKFLSNLRKWPNVTRAARLANISRVTAYLHRREDSPLYDPDFSKAWDEALAEGVERQAEEAERRAFKGVNEPVYYKGVKVGTVKKYSDTLAIFLLKAHDPEKYRDRSSVDVTSDGKPITFKVVFEDGEE